MKRKYKVLDVSGALIDSDQLENYLQKLASDQIIKNNSDKNTYPVPRVKENLAFIFDVYNYLNEDLKNNIPIHPAGEWVLDNFYIIEKNAKIIIKELTLKKYTSFIGLANGANKGFSRVYVLAKEIISYTDGKIDGESLERYLKSYQNKKTLSMEELWSINLFLQISLIEKIRLICEKIYLAQMQKRKVENMVTRLIDFEDAPQYKINKKYSLKLEENVESKYPFIEYLSYKLKQYGKRAISYVDILEHQVNKMGCNINECVNREHFDMASKKISIGNSIMSINALNRLNFIEIFNKTNGVEEVLKNDPAEIYDKMDYKTKEYYRNAIEQISRKTKISEIYIAKKTLELATSEYEKGNKNDKKTHIGYYLISDGRYELLGNLLNKKVKQINKDKKALIYILIQSIVSVFVSCCIGSYINFKTKSFFLGFFVYVLSIIIVKNIFMKIVQYFSSKFVKPKLIPKLDFYSGIPEEHTTMVVIPTIIKDEEKVKQVMKKLEVFYMANKSKNLYFTLLGDCCSSKNEKEDFDEKIVAEGIKQCKLLNKKYESDEFPIFNFVYRKRTWCEGEQCFLGWERKRGLLTQFNEYLLNKSNDVFYYNSFEFYKKCRCMNLETVKANMDNIEIPNIKYIITLDADTNLVLNTAFELVGAMAHILNRPIMDDNKRIISGYGLIQPRVGVGLNETNKSNFTKIFSGLGGTDSYTNAISDFYFDNFDEGIFTGKGIYDLSIFCNVLEQEIPENTVLSHDLLEGCYVRCGLASDIVLMDGYPTSYSAYKSRLHRWIRGDYQIFSWILKRKLNVLSKYKIIDNINRSLLDASCLLLLVSNLLIKSKLISVIAIISAIIPYLIDFINKILSRKNKEVAQKKFYNEINGYGGFICKAFIDISLIPDKSYFSINAAIKSIYRMVKSKKHLLEWTTAEEAEQISQRGYVAYYKKMIPNVIFGVIFVILGVYLKNIFNILLGTIWLIGPAIMNYLSTPIIEIPKYDLISDKDKEYVIDIAQKTWLFFKENINSKSNFLPPDNYQENRKQKIVYRTSPTNIGLGLLSVVASYDLGFESQDSTVELLTKMIETIDRLPKWNGHLYNWYDISNLTPLMPRYVSSVDSGNFVGYLYTLKQFLNSQNKQNQNIEKIIATIDRLINNTDFSKLFDEKNGLFSIGFNIEENKMTDSYYDLLASEARQTSLVAIAKKDISAKHWKNLSRTLTVLNKYKGLISWSGTAFEYLMPTINIRRYPNSLLDESCKFMIMSQIEYAKKLGTTWGISEAAFNLKDFNNNYQYKAFGIPWLGLKRGLADEMVVSSYGCILAINDYPKEVINNLKRLEQCGMNDKYGFYESIDYTPSRAPKDKKYEIVKTYMAHHQGLILLSIDNLVNNNILQKRFFENPEIEAIDILLQERMPDNVIITKEQKERVEKIKYTDFDYYSERVLDKKNNEINEYNFISNGEYNIFIDKNGNGYSKYKDNVINRFKETDDVDQGIQFYIKNTENNKIWSVNNLKFLERNEERKIIFAPNKSEFDVRENEIYTKMTVFVSPEESVEIRSLNVKNLGNKNERLEISNVLEPVISSMQQDNSHRAFNNLFLSFENYNGIIVAKRKFRLQDKKNLYMAVTLHSDYKLIGDLEFEIDKKILCGRYNLDVPYLIRMSKPFSNKIENVVNPIISFRETIELIPDSEAKINLIISVSENKNEAIKNVEKYLNNDSVERALKLSKAQSEAKVQYLGIRGKDVNLYQRILSHVLLKSGKSDVKSYKNNKYEIQNLWKYGISGDNPIILLKVKDIVEINIVKEIVKAYEYFKIHNIKVDIIIENNEAESYENYLREAVDEIICSNGLCKNNGGGIFCLNNLSQDDKNILELKANLILCGYSGSIESQLDDIDYESSKQLRNIKLQNKQNLKYLDAINDISNNYKIEMNDLKYFNKYGGFSADGKEYLINVNKNNKLPLAWSNILANDKFGTVVTENLGGYTWYKNSRLNRISAWNNDVIDDIPSEVLYFSDDENNIWTPTISPIEDNNEYYIKYGIGYANYKHMCNNITHDINVFVPYNDSAKIYMIKLKNSLTRKKSIKLIYFIKNVLDEDEIKSNGNINLNFDRNSNCIIANNLIKNDFNSYMYISSSEKIKSYTGLKKEFFGNGNLANPDGIKIDRFSCSNSLGNDGIIAYNMEFEIEALGQKDIVIVLGAADNEIDCKNSAYKYSKIENCQKDFEKTIKYWNLIVNKITVSTPVESLNIMVNSWIIYQTLCSRILARTGYYQSGGAYGFRDQLQDAMSLKYVDSEITRNQIIKHCKHQFIEGDVLHWWHEENGRGIRTKFSDDLLWLPYVVCDYIEFTNDYSILDEEISYLKGDLLEENCDEKYDFYGESDIKESVYLHCIKAIKKACNLGKNNIPKIGSGDWNDGFSNIGNKGNGESVWLGFFLYDVLNKFEVLCKYKNDIDNNIEIFKSVREKLKEALNTVAWDGKWFKRAFADDGFVLGTIQNQECKIDSISQSWSVISKVADDEKKYMAMESLENHLVDKNSGIIKLLDPPFSKSDFYPGYIQAYLPGTRENGGQYTHAAIWAIIAETILGFGDKSIEYLNMINPIEHTKTKELADKYQIEPYVISADIYGFGNLSGRGGWSWYTGSASWYYICVIKYILGLRIEYGELKICPCISKDWNEYNFKYKFGESIYNIVVRNPDRKNTGVSKFIYNGEELEEHKIKLVDNREINNIEIIM